MHRGQDRFGITTRLAQALAKYAKEICRAAHANGHRKPRMRRWTLGKTVRLGWRKGRLCVEVMLEKVRPALKTVGVIVGMDSNYKHGLVFSDGQTIGDHAYATIQSFATRQKHAHAYIKSLVGHALKHLDWTHIRVLCIEDLKHVKKFLRGTFLRRLNRRLSHWLYNLLAQRLACRCEERGIRLERKNPAYTSQYCRLCGKWDRRNRKSDQFVCISCGHVDHADLNAAQNLALLGLAGQYGVRSLPKPVSCVKKPSIG